MTTRSRLGALAVALLLALAGPLAADAPTGPRSIPDVAGLARADAERRLGAAGFELEIVMEPSGEIAEGVVIRQEPGGFAIREIGSTVRVIVSGKPEPKQPDLNRGPKPRPPAPMPSEPPPAPPPSEPPPSEPPPPTPEEPPAGAIPELAPVAPPAPVAPAPTPEVPAAAPGSGELPEEPGLDRNGPALPNVTGMSRQEVEAALPGYTLAMEVTLASAESHGRVVEQIPAPGETLAHGQPVTLVFGLMEEPGAQYRQVPVLEGLTLEEAQARLTKYGFVGSFCTIPSENDKAGRVLDTTPRRFSFLLKGEVVRVRLGRSRGGSLPPPVMEHPTPVPAPTLPPAPTPTPTPTPTPPTDAPPAGPLPTDPPAAPPSVGHYDPALPPQAPPVVRPPVGPPVVEAPPTPPPAPLPEPAPFPAQPVRPPPGRTALTGPVEGDSFPKAYGPSFEWQTVPNADGYEWELEREETEGVWRPARSEKLIGTKYRPARLEAARYRWRVRALNGEVPGEWTTWRRLFLY